MRKEIVLAILVTLSFLIAGVSCLFWPSKVKRLVEGSIWDPYRGWGTDSNYMFWIRMMGIFAMLAFVLGIYVIIVGIVN